MEWRENFVGKKPDKVGVVSVKNTYARGAANTALFEKAGVSIKKNDYDQAVSFLRQILNTDPKDFEAWTELGTALLSQNKTDDAERAYLGALAEHPNYMLALVNLGKLRLIQKQYEKAVETLDQAVKVQPKSATANYYLGEAYLQIKKGSKAVVYLREALNLDPIGKADAHLRLAALYNAAGLKDKAAAEYEDFLKKKPDYPAKKKLEQYITQNKKL
jgi:tetratricopeptide (TPR) repeat protein